MSASPTNLNTNDNTVVFSNRTSILDPEDFDPSEAEKKAKDDDKKNKSPYESIISTISIIVVSGLIFIILVAWADVLRTYMSSYYLPSIDILDAKAKLAFAIVATIIGFFISLIFICLWLLVRTN